MGLNYINRAVSERLYYSHGYYDVFADIAFSPHVHDVWEIIYFVRGDMSYSVEGRVYTVKSGDVILTRPSAIHMITPNPGTVYERYCALIDFKSIPRQTVKKIPKERDIFKCRGNERIEGLFSKLDDYCRMFQGEELEHLIIGIFEELVLNLSLIIQEDGESVAINPLVEKAIKYIKDNLTEIRNISEISSALYVTKSHLHHIFLREMKVTPSKYITSKRLLLAQKKIRSGERPTDVYEKCGFEDYATFFRNYKSYFGYSPSSEGKVAMKNTVIS